MRIAIYSDIHANLPAFEAVLKDIKTQSIDRCFNLGDLVGYGPFPEEVVALARELKHPTLLGNHDKAVVDQRAFQQGRMRYEETFAVLWPFSAPARASMEWTEQQLSDASIAYLAALPFLTHRTSKLNTLRFYHAAPHSYDNGQITWDYVTDQVHVLESLTAVPPENIAFFGHSHCPGIYRAKDLDGEFRFSRDGYDAEKEETVLVNVGSVGQPRDHNPDACYCIYDTKTGKIRFRARVGQEPLRG